MKTAISSNNNQRQGKSSRWKLGTGSGQLAGSKCRTNSNITRCTGVVGERRVSLQRIVSGGGTSAGV